MPRTMGIDFGERRIGIALSDPGAIIASAHGVLRCGSVEEAVAGVARVCREQQVERVVVGLPLNMDGSRGPSAQKAEQFAGALRERLDVPVETWDERLSTLSAEKALIEGGTRREKRKELVDKVAAQIILQHYLDARSAGCG